ncbi:metallopeptidase family protein [Brooklawnia cerclae]|uniref:Zn-dependent protease with MMP-like domain n=1 Tax=Brooklawnia cerclae TaxID=349934 RepID=A0ABX0SJC4_9ACTN|nr:metallopeptidase family protein [Brooklawnia cerclae]NIH58066.1 putative Zn-dependent protease with MMP-like domain [Brooklawnia cerclae]
MAIEVGDQEFDACVDEALDSIPDELAELIDNCVVLVEEEPPPGEDLFGYYDGVPLTERGGDYTGVLPDRILIFRGPHRRECGTLDELVDEIHITVVHEIAHHFGIDDEALHDLGYD